VKFPGQTDAGARRWSLKCAPADMREKLFPLF